MQVVRTGFNKAYLLTIGFTAQYTERLEHPAGYHESEQFCYVGTLVAGDLGLMGKPVGQRLA